MALPADHKAAVAELLDVVPYEALRDLTSNLPKWDFGGRRPELEAAKREAFEALHDCRARLQRIVDAVSPRLAERIAQERAEDEATDEGPFTGPCRNWPANIAAMGSNDIEAALAAKKIGELL